MGACRLLETEISGAREYGLSTGHEQCIQSGWRDVESGCVWRPSFTGSSRKIHVHEILEWLTEDGGQESLVFMSPWSRSTIGLQEDAVVAVFMRWTNHKR
jgi:hypothetical protein